MATHLRGLVDLLFYQSWVYSSFMASFMKQRIIIWVGSTECSTLESITTAAAIVLSIEVIIGIVMVIIKGIVLIGASRESISIWLCVRSVFGVILSWISSEEIRNELANKTIRLLRIRAPVWSNSIEETSESSIILSRLWSIDGYCWGWSLAIALVHSTQFGDVRRS